ncbi:MAG: hypothetical protein HY908_08830 [Myxococcales bacterium]|nr:hypothetical protein [Myxococcales bacterium]
MATENDGRFGDADFEQDGSHDGQSGDGFDPLAIDGALACKHAQTADTAITREQRRSRRKRAVRARTLSVKRMTKRELELGRMLYPETDYYRPRTRAECAGGPRPCPYVACGYHLYLDVSPRTGAIKLNFPDLEVWDMNETCALDVADRGGTTLEDVGAIMNLTRERIRQVEVRALAKLEALRDMMALRDYVDEGPNGKRRLPVLSDDDDLDDEDGLSADAADEDEDEDDEIVAVEAVRERAVPTLGVEPVEEVADDGDAWSF